MSNPLLDTSGLPRFDAIKPEHARPALEELIAAHRQKLAAILDDPDARDIASLIVPVEEMSHELSLVWSPVSHLQSVLEDPAWRDAYNDSLPLMTEHGTELSQNRKLYEAYLAVADGLPDDADPALKALIEQALRDFRLAGVALPEDQKERYREIMQSLAAAHARFYQNVQDATDAWRFDTTDEAKIAGLPAPVIARAKEAANEAGIGGYRIGLDYPNYHAVLTHADDRELRETFYRAWSTLASDQGDNPELDNSELIREILALRHEAAALVGFDNYAEYSLATKMADEVSEVIDFLKELSEKSHATAEAELAEIQGMADAPLDAWDVAYYMEKLKEQKYDVTTEALREYFPASVVRDGMFGVAERLYGFKVVKIEGMQRWHEDVSYYELRGADGELIGSFFTDLFARTGKRSGAWIDECVVRKNLTGERIPPVGHLVCNFPPLDADGVSLLSHTDVVTLFHEFGHMLHHLLTRIDYPSIAGINGVPWDAVELPSQFMENFAWSYAVLKESTAHAKTGEPLPRDLFDRLEDSRHFGQALQMLRQIEFALFDFRLHAEYDPQNPADVIDVLREVRSEVAVVDHPDYNRSSHSFGHIFSGGYAAGYYSYKWAEVLAADAFAAFEESGIFDRGTASRFRSEILEVGGSRDFMDAYVAFRGRKPTLDALLRHSGIGIGKAA